MNADQIFNDDKYEYEEVGRPFLVRLGRAVYSTSCAASARVAPTCRASACTPETAGTSRRQRSRTSILRERGPGSMRARGA